ncbi:MAG: hypothetical protein K6D96_03240 [Acetatifactor sp.]|nr:hypothetical protein [Acetatifactor sp.]
MKKKLSALLTLCLCMAFVLLPCTSTITAKADSPATYCLRYDTAKSDWRYIPGSSWDDTAYNRETYYLNEVIKDGDYIVIDNTNSGNAPDLTFNVALGNLTAKNTAGGCPVVYAKKGVTDVYVLGGQFLSVTGDVTNLHVYDDGKVTIHGNINNVTGHYATSYKMGITADGTVDKYKVDNSYTKYYPEYYTFKKGTFNVKDGALITQTSSFSTTPPADTASSETASAAASASDDELDDVPKTGDEIPVYVWYALAGAAIFFVTSFLLKRLENSYE